MRVFFFFVFFLHEAGGVGRYIGLRNLKKSYQQLEKIPKNVDIAFFDGGGGVFCSKKFLKYHLMS